MFRIGPTVIDFRDPCTANQKLSAINTELGIWNKRKERMSKQQAYLGKKCINFSRFVNSPESSSVSTSSVSTSSVSSSPTSASSSTSPSAYSSSNSSDNESRFASYNGRGMTQKAFLDELEQRIARRIQQSINNGVTVKIHNEIERSAYEKYVDNVSKSNSFDDRFMAVRDNILNESTNGTAYLSELTVEEMIYRKGYMQALIDLSGPSPIDYSEDDHTFFMNLSMMFYIVFVDSLHEVFADILHELVNDVLHSLCKQCSTNTKWIKYHSILEFILEMDKFISLDNTWEMVEELDEYHLTKKVSMQIN